ncbi:MAG: alpha/beta fold hydrolase [Rhodospirillales bacterium]|nr:alpha/beta fold hydrolase [Rhodospirillales bacterium]
MDTGYDLEIRSTYDWCVRAFSLVKSRLGVNIKLRHEKGQIETGQIFLFNHFARFETVIPQYLIHQETGAYCRCVAAAELFKGGDSFARFLYSVGAVPNNHPGLLPFLAAEILRGRKVIVFPEGGMVKDRRVLDEDGEYTIFSRTAHKRRKHHSGAAVIALTLEMFKKRILSVQEAGETDRLLRWVRALGLADVDALLAAARQPTLIVPANITFYPLRVTDNILKKGVELFGKGMKEKFIEELLIEGNILFKNTDMDIQFGPSIAPAMRWRWWERRLLAQIFNKVQSLDDLFTMKPDAGRWDERLFSVCVKREVDRLRDIYMRDIYAQVTVNLSHLASSFILMLMQQGQAEVDRVLFQRTLYLAIKRLQRDASVHLHRSIGNPELYERLDEGLCPRLEQFLSSPECAHLVKVEQNNYRFLPKVVETHSFDNVRLENVIEVYANEAAPIQPVAAALRAAMEEAPTLDDRDLALHLFDDERVSYRWDREKFAEARFEKINRQETATADGEPYLLLPEGHHRVGVVMVHGLLASPAELRVFAEKLAARGHPVIGVRLKGHGTSPWDLRERGWEDWFASVQQGYRIMSALAERVCVVGFSTGGALSLLLAAEHPENLAGVASVSTPYKFMNRNLLFVPLLHGMNKLASWIPSLEGIMPFRPNRSEHPHINYYNIPIRSLYELGRVVEEMGHRLHEISSPVLLLQGAGDKVVNPQSAEIIRGKLGAITKTLHMVPSDRHGILNEDVGETQQRIVDFLATLDVADAALEFQPAARHASGAP